MSGLVNVGVSEERLIFADAFVQVEEHRRGFAGNGVVGVRAGEGGLVKDGAFIADETVLLPVNHPTGVVRRVTAVEDFAVVIHIGKVAISVLLALEARLDVLHHDLLGSGWQPVSLAGALCPRSKSKTLCRLQQTAGHGEEEGRKTAER